MGTLGDPELDILTSAGASIANNDDGGGNLNSRIVWTAPDSQTYYLRARSAVGGSGTYTLTVSGNNPATGAPTITGTAQVGQTLTAGTSGIMDADGLTTPGYSYQWVRVNGTDADISGATLNTYTLVAADLGKTIKVKVSFTDDASNAETLTSAAAAAVTAKPNTPATGAPTISGTAQVGQTLTAATSGISDADGLGTFSYQWIRVDSGADADISGATSSTYTLVAADLGKTIKVKVSFTDDASNAETLTSAATAAVTAAGTVKHAQTTEVWSATLTSANSWAGLGSINYDGYGSDASQYIPSNHGSLSPNSFTIGATTHKVDSLVKTRLEEVPAI